MAFKPAAWPSEPHQAATSGWCLADCSLLFVTGGEYDGDHDEDQDKDEDEDEDEDEGGDNAVAGSAASRVDTMDGACGALYTAIGASRANAVATIGGSDSALKDQIASLQVALLASRDELERSWRQVPTLMWREP